MGVIYGINKNIVDYTYIINLITQTINTYSNFNSYSSFPITNSQNFYSNVTPYTTHHNNYAVSNNIEATEEYQNSNNLGSENIEQES